MARPFGDSPGFDLLHNFFFCTRPLRLHITEKKSVCQPIFEKIFPKIVEIKKFFYFAQRNVSSLMHSDENVFHT